MKIIVTKFIRVCVSLSVIGLTFSGQSFAEIDPGTCVGAWLFEEGSGNIAQDFSGNGNDGNLKLYIIITQVASHPPILM